MSAPARIEIYQLQKMPSATPLLDIETLTVAAGEIVAIVGPVGSGKTELLDLLTGQSQPTRGTVRVCGLDPRRDHQRLSQRVGVVFRENGLYERQSVRANLTFHCSLRGLPNRRADEVLAEVGLADHAATPAARLPANLARRLAFGRAILHKPQALLLMDPFAGCDTASCAVLSQSMRQMAQGGAAVLILTREGAGLAALCRAVYTLEQGRLRRVDIPQGNEEPKAELPFKVPARQEGQVVLVNPADILFASAEEDQTHLHTTMGEIPSHLSMGDLETRLLRNGFFRAHRSYLVNLQRVKAIIPYTRDSYTLILDDPANTEIPLSRNAAKELRELLGY